MVNILEGSIKRYKNDTIQFLVEDENEEGCLTKYLKN